MNKLLNKAKQTHNLEKSEIVELLIMSDASDLFKAADEVRQLYVGNEVHLRGLIEFTNICRCNCQYCGIRVENKSVNRYRLLKDEIILVAKQAVDNGFKTIVLQGGEDVFFDKDVMREVIEGIKKFDVALTLSIGERSFEDYKAFKQAGADRFLLRIETTDRNLYKTMHPNMDFDNRVRCLKYLKELGYETGTGCLIGLPNQSVESLADDILFFKTVDADMVGVGPFIPHPQTPLAKSAHGSFDLSLRVMAITRLLLPDINIPATTAMETLYPNGRMIALQSGANVFMPNVTGLVIAQNYEIYPNKAGINGCYKGVIEAISDKLSVIGRTVSKNKGFRGGK